MNFLLNLSRVLAHSVVFENERALKQGCTVLASCDPKNSILSGSLGAVLGADAQANAADKNAQNVADTNALNYKAFQEGRGSTGSAIYPIYASQGEAQLYGDTLKTYDATGALQPTAADYQKIIDASQPSVDASQKTAAGIFNGNLLSQETQNLQPVNAARSASVTTQKQGTLEALQQTLNNIKAIQAGKGFSGDSLGTKLLEFGARRDANTTAANSKSAVDIQNATDLNRIQANDINRQVQNLNLPLSMAQQKLSLAAAPANAIEDQMARRQQLFNNFRIGTGQFTYQNMPLVQPNSAAYGALANIGATGNALGSAIIKNPSFFGIGTSNAAGGAATGVAGGAAAGESVGAADEGLAMSGLVG